MTARRGVACTYLDSCLPGRSRSLLNPERKHQRRSLRNVTAHVTPQRNTVELAQVKLTQEVTVPIENPVPFEKMAFIRC